MWQVSTEPHELSPLAGVRVSVTNFGVRDRDEVAQALKDLGAEFSAELYKNMTHLVCRVPEGPKHK